MLAIITLLLLPLCLAGQMNLHLIPNAQLRGALCNDGSPAGFYYEMGSGAGSDTWVLHHAGGYACFDEATCTGRAKSSPALTSSKTWSATMDSDEGIFSDSPTSNPTFYNAHKVIMQYCSSDYWGGTRGPISNNSGDIIDGWSFAGRNITQAILEDLQADFGMNSSNTQILYTGCSAGGKGVFVNVDFARSQLKFTPKKFLGFADEGWSADIALGTQGFPYFDQFVKGTPLWQPAVSSICAAAHPQHLYFCFLGSLAIPYISTPLIMTAQQYDIVQFSEDSGLSYNGNNQQHVAWMEQLRKAFVNSFVAPRSPHTIFSPACAYHCSSVSPAFTLTTIGGVSISQALAKFWESGGGVPNIVDDCPAFNCSTGCQAM